MGKDESGQPDPMAEIGGIDIDALLEQTSSLAAKAGKEVGDPSKEERSARAVDLVAGRVGQEEDKTGSQGDEGGAPAKVDDKLAELEAMLGNVAQKVEEQPEEEEEDITGIDGESVGVKETSSGTYEAETTEVEEGPATSSGGGEGLTDFDDYDDFDISVDLSDDQDAAEAEIAEKLSGKTGDNVATIARSPLVDRIVTSPLTLLSWVALALDAPFAGLSPEIKQVFGYIAIATLVVATGGLIYGSVAH
ncbi:MAG: hypothetical protein JXQ73_05510 [Phycisphaerae bacterium]|nr:hypothetical protein [Phycisphaerae bacterium]